MADQTRIERGVWDVVANQLGYERTEIKATNELVADLDADSLDRTEMIMDLEELFGISISENEMIEWAKKRHETAKDATVKSDVFDPESSLKYVTMLYFDQLSSD